MPDDDLESKMANFASAAQAKKQGNGAGAQLNISGSGNTIIFGDNNRTLGEKVPYQRMTKDERTAYDAGIWDGVERRDFEAVPVADHGNQRAMDTAEHVLYYVATFACLLILFVWIGLAFRFSGEIGG